MLHLGGAPFALNYYIFLYFPNLDGCGRASFWCALHKNQVGREVQGRARTFRRLRFCEEAWYQSFKSVTCKAVPGLSAPGSIEIGPPSAS